MGVVSFTGVTKVYPPAVRALDDVSVTIEPGEIHAFVGENGAGKSTLMKVLNGEIRPDNGTLDVFGKRTSYRSARDAIADGVGMVHQEILLVDRLTVWENVVLGIEPVGRRRGPPNAKGRSGKSKRPGRFGLIDRQRAVDEVRRTIDDAGLSLDPEAVVGTLTVGARQKVEIAKLLHRNVKILILDEPTAVLTPQEIPELFDELRRLRNGGRTVCFISHHLDEVVLLADRVSVLRDGRLIATVDAATTSVAALARLMVERDVVFTTPRPPHDPGGAVLEIRRLRGLRARSSNMLGPLDLSVHSGEIVGVAGVEGNGQHDLVSAIVGSMPSRSDALSIAGHDLRLLSILDRRRHLSYVPAERKTEGGALTASLVENVAMTHHRLSRGFSTVRGWLFERRRAATLAVAIRDGFNVASSSVEAPLGSLSGGNQQKVILGRELSADRPFVVLDQPTRGVDVGSIEEIHRRILDLRTNDCAVLVVSADLGELLRICDRLVVMYRGNLVLDIAVEDATLALLGTAMLEGRDDRVHQ